MTDQKLMRDCGQTEAHNRPRLYQLKVAADL
jgi:hypothetical protein